MPLTLDESGRLAGGHRWAETELFRILGVWVPGNSGAVQLMLDRHSAHAAWRAAQWWDRLPVLADTDRESLSSPPLGWDGAFSYIASLEGTLAQLAAAYRVAFPRLWASYNRHLQQADEVTDSSSRRTLRLVADDLAADWHDGEVALQSAIDGPAAAEQAAAAVAALEGLFAGPADAGPAAAFG